MFVAFAGAVVAGALSGLQPAPFDANQMAVPGQPAVSGLCPGLKPIAFAPASQPARLIRAGFLEHRKSGKPLARPDIRVTVGCFDIETDEILEMQAEAFNRRLGADLR